MKDFAGKTVIVTGAASGFGKATATRFHEKGASVVLVDKDAETLKSVAEQFADNALAITCDVSDPEAVEQMFSRAIGHCHRAFRAA
ncbi:SDR family NAD(P)-dependent oxidoreductase [Gluconobacter roseus]|uniref:SDR family NAD(P)-dependent oxidoreductase n=1 Tax=Gluconobacter roseus TaxID=586239 RepID=UPI0038D10089